MTSLRPVQHEFLWCVQSEAGTGRPNLLLVTRVPDVVPEALWKQLGGEVPVPVAYRVGTVEVHRMSGSGRFLPVELALVNQTLFVSAGGTPRSQLEGLLSGRLAAGLSHHPAFREAQASRGRGALLLGTVDVVTLLRMVTDTQKHPLPPSERSDEVTEYVLSTDGVLLEGLWRVPHGQIDRLVPLMQPQGPMRPRLPGSDTDWDFPNGI